MSPEFWLSLVTIITTCITTCVTIIWQGHKSRVTTEHVGYKAAIQRTEAAKEVVHVKTALKKADAVLQKAEAEHNKKLDEISAVGQATHVLVNNKMMLMLQKNASQAERIAELTKRPEDMKEAEDARTQLEEHNKRQSVVDRLLNGPSIEGIKAAAKV